MKKIFVSITVIALVTVLTISVNSRNIIPTNENVGIGTLTPSAKLDVNGRKFTNSELIIKDVANNIKMYKHSPGVLTVKEIEEKGVGIGQIQIIQTEKIEELTLYTIQQDKKNNQLENTFNDLQNQLNDLKAMLK